MATAGQARGGLRRTQVPALPRSRTKGGGAGAWGHSGPPCSIFKFIFSLNLGGRAIFLTFNHFLLFSFCIQPDTFLIDAILLKNLSEDIN